MYHALLEAVAKVEETAERTASVKGTGRIAAIRNGVGEGERNDAARDMALWYLTRFDDDTAEAWDALLTWDDLNEPPLKSEANGRRELRYTFESARRFRARTFATLEVG